MSDFDAQAARAIPAEVHMISGSHDTQTSADVSNVGTFRLPDPAGRAGGACTSALLQVLHNKPESQSISWVGLLRAMRQVLLNMGFDQVPQLTSSRFIDVNKDFQICPPTSKGTKRAVLIGINYTGQQGQLSGCHNDVGNIFSYLKDKQGFAESDCLVLMDNKKNHSPTKENIMNAFARITQYAVAGDIVFVHYSGHGGRLRDDNGDEDDGYDETLVPVDFQRNGQIRDDDILKTLVRPLKAGVVMTCLMDCCHSGTVLDLPYRFTADGDVMKRNDSINFDNLMGSPESAIGCLLCLYCLFEQFFN